MADHSGQTIADHSTGIIGDHSSKTIMVGPYLWDHSIGSIVLGP